MCPYGLNARILNRELKTQVAQHGSDYGPSIVKADERKLRIRKHDRARELFDSLNPHVMKVFIFLERRTFQKWEQDLWRDGLGSEPDLLRHPFGFLHALQLPLVPIQPNLIPPHFGKLIGGGSKHSLNDGGERNCGGDRCCSPGNLGSVLDEFVGFHSFTRNQQPSRSSVLTWIGESVERFESIIPEINVQ